MISIKRKELYERFKEQKTTTWKLKYEHAFLYVQRAFNLEGQGEKVLQTVKKQVIRECSRIREKWDSSNRTEQGFLAKNEEWLNKEISFPYSPKNVLCDLENAENNMLLMT